MLFPSRHACERQRNVTRCARAPQLGLIPCPHMLGNDLSRGKHRAIGGGSLMRYRLASAQDCPMLAVLNAQLIQDEGHRNRMTVAELEDRMREWLTSGEYQALLWEDHHEVVAYAFFEKPRTRSISVNFSSS